MRLCHQLQLLWFREGKPQTTSRTATAEATPKTLKTGIVQECGLERMGSRWGRKRATETKKSHQRKEGKEVLNKGRREEREGGRGRGRRSHFNSAVFRHFTRSTSTLGNFPSDAEHNHLAPFCMSSANKLNEMSGHTQTRDPVPFCPFHMLILNGVSQACSSNQDRQK